MSWRIKQEDLTRVDPVAAAAIRPNLYCESFRESTSRPALVNSLIVRDLKVGGERISGGAAVLLSRWGRLVAFFKNTNDVERPSTVGPSLPRGSDW
jgi:hypothetical protein